MTRAEDFGHPHAIYGFFTGPFKRFSNKFCWTYTLRFGLSYNWNPFDLDLNPLQTAIGSYGNVYLSLGTSFDWIINKWTTLNFGISSTHFSNGAISVPNKGINLLGSTITLSYNINAEKAKSIEFRKGEIPEFVKEYEFYTMMGIGSRNIKALYRESSTDLSTVDNLYPMATLQLFIQKQISWKSKFGIGVDLMFDGSLSADADLVDEIWDGNVKYSFSEGLSAGLAASYELVISDLSILIQPAYEFARKETPGRPGRFYQRLGIKYYLSKQLFVGVNVHSTELANARYIEWNAGYRIRWKSKA